MGERTRRHPSRTILRHDARKRPLKPARWEDLGKYFRCWNCGFICDVDRDSLGGPEDRSGTGSEFEKTTLPDNGWIDYGRRSVTNALKDWNHTVLVRVNGAGTPLPIELSYSPTVNQGCPFCGSLNWRGDYR